MSKFVGIAEGAVVSVANSHKAAQIDVDDAHAFAQDTASEMGWTLDHSAFKTIKVVEADAAGWHLVRAYEALAVANVNAASYHKRAGAREALIKVERALIHYLNA